MAKYILTNKAVEDISKIWDYTYEIWSERQADNYYELLIKAFAEIAQQPDIGKNYTAISKELYGFGVGKHIVFYRIVKHDIIEIVRILHERMDLRNRIGE